MTRVSFQILFKFYLFPGLIRTLALVRTKEPG